MIKDFMSIIYDYIKVEKQIVSTTILAKICEYICKRKTIKDYDKVILITDIKRIITEIQKEFSENDY